MIVTENQLDEWVRGNARDAQGVIVELVWRLVAASSPKPKERRFPLGDAIGQHGPDGLLDVDLAFDPFVPEALFRCCHQGRCARSVDGEAGLSLPRFRVVVQRI